MMDKIFKCDGPGNKHYDLAYQKFWPSSEAAPSLSSSSELSERQTSPEMTTLGNGVRVITQANNVPGQLHMNLLLGVGSRDETSETSGSLHSIKTTRYKSSLVTNETVNYGMVQMSGGSYAMDFDREVSSFTASCLDHDVVDLFSMMADCALEPRNLLAANVAMEKLAHSHKLARATNGHHDLDDMVMSNIYGYSGLGNKLLGEENNIRSLNAFVLQKFQMENITTDKLVVSAFGVNNHHEFVELVDMKLGGLQAYGAEKNPREVSTFKEGRVAVPENSNSTNVVVCFEGASWSSSNMVANQVLDSLLGGVEVNSFEGLFGPEGELNSIFYSKETGVNGVEAFAQHFSDSGVFGLRLNAQAESAPGAVGRLLKSVSTLISNLTEEQFNSAKLRLKMRVFRALDNPPTRVEELSRNVMTLDKLASSGFMKTLDGLTKKEFSQQASQILKGKMNVTAVGGNAENIPEISTLKKQMA